MTTCPQYLGYSVDNTAHEYYQSLQYSDRIANRLVLKEKSCTKRGLFHVLAGRADFESPPRSYSTTPFLTHICTSPIYTRVFSP